MCPCFPPVSLSLLAELIPTLGLAEKDQLVRWRFRYPPLLIHPLGGALLNEGSHSFLLIFQREEAVEKATLKAEALGQRQLVCCIDGLLGDCATSENESPPPSIIGGDEQKGWGQRESINAGAPCATTGPKYVRLTGGDRFGEGRDLVRHLQGTLHNRVSGRENPCYETTTKRFFTADEAAREDQIHRQSLPYSFREPLRTSAARDHAQQNFRLAKLSAFRRFSGFTAHHDVAHHR